MGVPDAVKRPRRIRGEAVKETRTAYFFEAAVGVCSAGIGAGFLVSANASLEEEPGSPDRAAPPGDGEAGGEALTESSDLGEAGGEASCWQCCSPPRS